MRAHCAILRLYKKLKKLWHISSREIFVDTNNALYFWQLFSNFDSWKMLSKMVIISFRCSTTLSFSVFFLWAQSKTLSMFFYLYTSSIPSKRSCGYNVWHASIWQMTIISRRNHENSMKFILVFLKGRIPCQPVLWGKSPNFFFFYVNIFLVRLTLPQLEIHIIQSCRNTKHYQIRQSDLIKISKIDKFRFIWRQFS